MSGNGLSGVTISIKCRRCGNIDEHQLVWFRTRREAFCSACGEKTPVSEEMLMGLFRAEPAEKAPQAISQKSNGGAYRQFIHEWRGVVILVAVFGWIPLTIWLDKPKESPVVALQKPEPPKAQIPRCPFTLEPGQILKRPISSAPNGLHQFTIRNGSTDDAIIVLRDVISGRAFVSFFVPMNGTASYNNVPDGSYKVQWIMGSSIAPDCHSFLKSDSAGEFDNVDYLKTVRTSAGLEYAKIEYTLYKVPNGNARSHSVDPRDVYQD